MNSRSFFRSAPATGLAMLISGLAASLTYLLVAYTNGLSTNTYFMWVYLMAIVMFLPGAIVAMPLGFLTAMLWVRGRPARNAIWLGLGYGLVLILSVFVGDQLWVEIQRQVSLGRAVWGYIASFVIQLGAYPLAAWATYKAAPWFNRD